MKHNNIKIISNLELKTISYYIKNEADEWIHIDRSSPLSRKEYTKASIYERAESILEVINDVYNTGNRGVDLELECSNDEFIYLSSLIKKKYEDNKISSTQRKNTKQLNSINIGKKSEELSKNVKQENSIKMEINEKESISQTENKRKEYKKENANILCKQSKMQVAFAGKIGSGKTTLIEALAKINNIKFITSQENNYTFYKNMEESQLWYEIKGIDIGKKNIKSAQVTINKLVSGGVSVLIYCLSTNKIESIEEEILLEVQQHYSNVRILVVLTFCLDEDSTVYAEKISDSINNIKVLPVLAKDKKTRCGIISAYGLKDISKFIYGGKYY